MLLAGAIGATTTRLALVSAGDGPRRFEAKQEFCSADFKSLQPIVEAFLACSGTRPTSACFDVAAPVIAGYPDLTNLSWDLEDVAFCRDFGLDHVNLLNDLEATAHAVPYLQPGETAEVNAGCAGPHYPFLIWSGHDDIASLLGAVPVNVITVTDALLGAPLYGHGPCSRTPTAKNSSWPSARTDSRFLYPSHRPSQTQIKRIA